MRNRKRRRFFPKRPAVNCRIRPRRQRMEMHQLDVKLTSKRGKRIRQSRRRAVLIKYAAIGLTLMTASAAVRWAYRKAFYENSEFRLDRFVVATDGILTEADVAAAAQVEMGMNLMKIDLPAVRERIGRLPMVTGVRVHRELPDRLEVKIEERVPIAWLSCPPHGVRPRNTSRGFLIDEEGQVFRCRKLLKRFLDLPVIEVYHLPEPSEGTRIESDEIRRAIRLLAESDRQFSKDGLRVNEIRATNGYSMVCRYNTQLEVTFGAKEIDRGLQDLRWIVTHAHSAGQQLATVNVMPSRNIPVTFFTPTTQRATPLDAWLPRVKSLSNPSAEGDSTEIRLQRQLRSILSGG